MPIDLSRPISGRSHGCAGSLLSIRAAIVEWLSSLHLWSVPCPAGEPQWKLVSQDEFNKDGPVRGTTPT
jgi:hypothetical protein